MKVTFTDPIGSGCAVCHVPSAKTASQCIEALKRQGFLGPGTYQLVVNGQTMTPDQTLGDAAVVDGATVVVHKVERGA